MKLIDLTVTEFTNLLSSSEPAPGGGSTAALEGALGIALTQMVGNFTTGRKKYAEHEEFITGLITEAEQIKRNFLEVIDKDTEAFHGVTAVFAMPKDTDEQKQARQAAMQLALKECTKTPYSMMCYALDALRLTAKAVGKTNTSAASDLGVGALSLKAAVQGAWLNILINIGGIKDEAFVEEYRSKGEAILQEALPLADQVYNAILESM